MTMLKQIVIIPLLWLGCLLLACVCWIEGDMEEDEYMGEDGYTDESGFREPGYGEIYRRIR